MKTIQIAAAGILLGLGLQTQALVAGTDFQTLVDAYHSTAIPAQVDDFNGPKKTCVAIKKDSPESVLQIAYGVKCGKILVPATPDKDIPATPAQDIPSAGPLLPAQHIPGQPARHIPGTPQVCAQGTDLLIFGGSDWITTATPKQLSVFSEGISGDDFEIAVAKNDQGIYSDIGQNIKFLIRKLNNYYPFVVVDAAGGITYAGYCY